MSDPALIDHNAHAPNLFETPDGSVLHCACCGRLQIAFRGLTLLITRDRFGTLRGTVAEAWEAMQEHASARAWRLSATTDAGDLSVTLRPDELRGLQRLLSGAAAMLTLQDRLADVANGAGRDTVANAAGRWGPASS
jgi:hypothetical protein